jgi:hypothetical protein
LQDVPFSHPVVLDLRPTGIRKVDSAYEAIEAKASPPCIRSHDLRGGLPD